MVHIFLNLQNKKQTTLTQSSWVRTPTEVLLVLAWVPYKSECEAKFTWSVFPWKCNPRQQKWGKKSRGEKKAYTRQYITKAATLSPARTGDCSVTWNTLPAGCWEHHILKQEGGGIDLLSLIIRGVSHGTLIVPWNIMNLLWWSFHNT